MALRSTTTLFLLVIGVSLMATQFVSSPDSGRQASVASCHEESAPADQVPQNHDCCALGHLHAVGSAPLVVVPSIEVTAMTAARLRLTESRETIPQARHYSDTGPPGSALPIRI